MRNSQGAMPGLPAICSGGTAVIEKGRQRVQNTPIVTERRKTSLSSQPLSSDMISRLFSEAFDQAICRKRNGRGPSRPFDGRDRTPGCHNWQENGTPMGVRLNPESTGFTSAGADSERPTFVRYIHENATGHARCLPCGVSTAAPGASQPCPCKMELTPR